MIHRKRINPSDPTSNFVGINEEDAFDMAGVDIADFGGLPDTSFVGLTHIYVQATAPSSPSTGDIWIDTSP